MGFPIQYLFSVLRTPLIAQSSGITLSHREHFPKNGRRAFAGLETPSEQLELEDLPLELRCYVHTTVRCANASPDCDPAELLAEHVHASSDSRNSRCSVDYSVPLPSRSMN